MRTRSLTLVLFLVLPLGLPLGGATLSCTDATESVTVSLPVRVSGAGGAPVTTDLGYEVELLSLRVALSDLEFTIAGEVHSAATSPLLGRAYAHPGHYTGGDITGELLGDFVFDWIADADQDLGEATLITGTYTAANFTFGTAPDVAEDDPLFGHTAIVEGTATKDGETLSFTFVLDAPEARELVGAPFEAEIRAETVGTILFRFDTLDPEEGDTFFDGVDFAAFDTDADGELYVDASTSEAEDAYNVLRRTFLTHDHYFFELESE